MEEQEEERPVGHCKEHGLQFDLEKQAGCPLCQFNLSATLPTKDRQRRPFGLIIAGLIGVSIFLIPEKAIEKVIRWTTPLASVHEEVSIRKLDPTPYQAEIQIVEQSLHRSGKLQKIDLDRISIYTNEIFKRIKAEEEGIPARVAQEQLFLFLIRLEEIKDQRNTPPSRDAIQEDWSEVRDQVFEPADWFDPPNTTAPSTSP